MRAGPTHKSPIERILAAARAEASMALDNLDDTEKVRSQLHNVEKMIRSVELQLGFGRLQTGEHLSNSGLDAHTLHWLNTNWTEAESHVADNLSHIESECGGAESPNVRTMKSNVLMQLGKAFGSEEVVEHLGKVGNFDFDTFTLQAMPQVKEHIISLVGLHLMRDGPCGNLLSTMQETDRFADLSPFQDAMTRFFRKIEDRYADDALYHGAAHATDVMSTSAWFTSSEFVSDYMYPLDIFMIFVASAIHDVGHMGRNNMFLTKTLHPLAIQYNDRSVLENMHLATSFGIMQDNDDCNWYKLLTDSQQYVRHGLITMVLGTDPSKHTKHLLHLTDLFQQIKDAPETIKATADRNDADKQKYLDNKILVLTCLLHAADVSNPTKPRDLMMQWTSRLLQEFWAQGDEERTLGIPISPLCDRASGEVTVPKGQIGFASFVIEPFYKVIADSIEETQEAMKGLAENVAFWKVKAAENATYDQLFGELGGVNNEERERRGDQGYPAR